MYPSQSKLTRLVDAPAEPITIAQARKFLRLETADADDGEDELIGDLITAARLECEQLADRSFLTTSWRLTLDDLPLPANPFAGFRPALVYAGLARPGARALDDGSILLPMPPLIELTAIRYVDTGGVTRTLDPAQVIVSAGTPGRISPAFARFFPLSQPRIAAIEIDYTAGYGDDPADVPKSTVQAIKMLTAFYYENRTPEAEPPRAVLNLLNVNRWGGYA